mgnify:CR=1 FL=1
MENNNQQDFNISQQSSINPGPSVPKKFSNTAIALIALGVIIGLIVVGVVVLYFLRGTGEIRDLTKVELQQEIQTSCSGGKTISKECIQLLDQLHTRFPETNGNSSNPSQASGPTNPPVPGWKIEAWHDPLNPILGFRFYMPDTWVEATQTNERRTEVSSCPPNTAGCDYVYLNVIVGSASQTEAYFRNLVSGQVAKEGGYATVEAVVSGIPAVELKDRKFGDDRIIYVQKDNEWFVFELNPGINNKIQAYETLEKIVSTFEFISAKAQIPPSEYQLLKDIDKWQVSYQDRHYNSLMVCADERKGSLSKPYTFSMFSNGYGESPGDIDTPYGKVITTLQNNGWVECGKPKNQQDPSNKGYDQIFIKNDKLIGVSTHYSMGTGNSLSAYIQYDKQPLSTYSKSEYGVEFKYPNIYAVKEGDVVDNDYWSPPRMNFITPGDRIATVEILSELFPLLPETNFEGAYFTLSTNKNLNLNECKKYLDNSNAPIGMTETRVVNGVTLYKGTIDGVARSHYGLDEFYHTYLNGTCYEFDLGTRKYLLAPEEIRVRDDDVVFVLENILSTVKIK